MTQDNIEADYLNEERLYFFHINGRKYMITFYEKSMRQRNMDPSYWTERSVRRRPQFVAESELHSCTRSGSVGFCVLVPRTQPLICVGCSVPYWVSCAINNRGYFEIAFSSSSTHICLTLKCLLTFCLTLTR